MTTVVVAGALANKAGSGGEAWVRMSYVCGFRRLGFEVYFLEQVARERCGEAAVRWFDDVVERFGLASKAALIDEEGRPLLEPSGIDLAGLAEEVGLLVNVSGNLRYQPLLERFRRKAFVDLDPGYTQLWHAKGSDIGLDGHHLYFTVGASIGTPACRLPTSGIDWRHTRPPVVLEDWPAAPGRLDRFTTLASWRGPYGPLEWDDVLVGPKAHEFRRFADLPLRAVPLAFEIALDIDAVDAQDRCLLKDSGWRLADPRVVAGTPDAFRAYVQGSGAEFSVAQGIYVATGCGWFADRTVRYLASRKPALVQDTGFSANLPVGEGLVPFATLDEAVEGSKRIVADYETHARAARRIAEEEFDSDKVLTRFLEDALA